MRVKTYEVIGHGEAIWVLIADYHQEYSAVWTERVSTPGSDNYALARVVWDPFMAESAFGEEAAAAAWVALEGGLPADKRGLLDGESATIWLLEGNLGGLMILFERLHDALDTTPSGDDDTFDYWPNTMDMLWELGTDLDEWMGSEGSGFRDRVRQLAAKVRRAKDYEPATSEWDGREWMEGYKAGEEGGE